MDGVKLREVACYSVIDDMWRYRWDAMVGDEQRTYCINDIQPGQLEEAREMAREALKDATASLPMPSHIPALNMTVKYV